MLQTNYDNIASTNYTHYDNMSLSNCTNSEIIDIFIRTLLLTIPFGLSIICLMSVVVYTLVKPLLGKNKNV